MKSSFPVALVQLHYHDRLGGVRQTMEAYGSAFCRRAGPGATNAVLCHRCGSWSDYTGTCIDLPEADYHRFRSRRAFAAAAERLTTRLKKFLCEIIGEGTVAMVGHNLSLGKNPALSEAFRRCALGLGNRAGARFRFFSVLHDVTEQGRFGLLHQLECLKSRGVDVDAALYARGAPVHFIAPDRAMRTLTGMTEEHLTILPHPVRSAASHRRCRSGEIRHILRRLAQADGLFFNPQLPLLVYPARMLYRKNVLEALLLATVMNGGSLVTGPAGSSSADRMRMNAALQLARRYRLSCAVDPERIRGFADTCQDHTMAGNPFYTLYGAADWVISTSIAEGFGYPFYEPWQFGVSVCGRKPAGVEFMRGFGFLSLYRRMPVPVSWVSIDDCCKRFAAAAHRGIFSRKRFLETFVQKETVDFGALDTTAQVTVIVRVLRSDKERAVLAGLLQKESRNCGNIIKTRMHDAEAEKLAADIAAWSRNGFDKAFVKCLAHNVHRIHRSVWYRVIAAWYRKPENMLITVPVAGMEKRAGLDKFS